MTTQPIDDRLLELIRTKGALNIAVMDTSLKIFSRLKLLLQQLETTLLSEFNKEKIKVQCTARGMYEVELRVSDDILIFILHSNIFVFDSQSPVFKSPYVKSDPSRASCGMISVYNFLADSVTFDRMHDVGQLTGRIFINNEEHFFVEGKKQLGVLFNDFGTALATEENIQKVIEAILLYCIEIDCNVPPIESMKEITVNDVRSYTIQNAIDSGNKLGFKFQNTKPNIQS